MLFKLSVKNLKKSFKDYAIYFVTLILGVAIFYVFNSLDAQQAMKTMSSSTYDIIKLMVEMLGGLSVFISFVLGFLIVYANNFLIKRRKKEFGIYMTLGMGKGQISRILLGETLLIGLVSLAVGLALGVFGAQFMSLLVVKMFGGVMDGYQFVFSPGAFFKTILYFGIMFGIIAVFNVISISRCRLIRLLSARKESEQVKMKNPWVCAAVFLAAVLDLAVQYYQVSNPTNFSYGKVGFIILSGCVGTFLFFWSLSGFLLTVMQKRKSYYLRDLNAFVLRQVHSKVNTTVFAMTVICIMLFMTISVLGGGLGMNYNFQKSLHELTPVDVNLAVYKNQEGNTENPSQTGIDMGLFQEDYVEVPVYETEELTLKKTLGDGRIDFAGAADSYIQYLENSAETIMKVSDYNRIAEFYGNETAELKENTYAVVCDYDILLEPRNEALKQGQSFSLAGKTFTPAYDACLYGFLDMAANHSNTGIILLPDDAVEEAWVTEKHLAANYAEAAKKNLETTESVIKSYEDMGLEVLSKQEIIELSGGLSAVITFVAIYLGIVFLISGAAILALKELSESSDNRERFEMLEKIGVDEKMMNRALFSQIAIFFFFPLALAVLHSVFGLVFIQKVMESMGKIGSLESILVTAGILVAVYGGYFLLTYLGSRSIVHNKN